MEDLPSWLRWESFLQTQRPSRNPGPREPFLSGLFSRTSSLSKSQTSRTFVSAGRKGRRFIQQIAPRFATLRPNLALLMTTAEEQYVHFFECIESLNSAWRILKDLETVPPGAIRAAAYRMALVEYAKPYKVSYGEHKKGRNGYLLPAPDLSPEDLSLHAQILNLRDKVLAHSDLTLKEAQVHASRFQGHPVVIVGSDQLPAFPNAAAVIALIERSLDLMYARREHLNESIAPNA